ncbi:CIA30 family protein [Polaribacter filamentus]|uniref:CIA30 family protein n=1 Tax=Polaribacter filamentus TaxID=53483 RepID=UPI00268ED477
MGDISLENNGGFSSVRYRFEKILINKSTKISVRIKGDGKKYQFRIKSNSGDYYSYISPFSTTGEWQEIEIPLKDMYPSFRGRKLDQPNFSNDAIEEITFLIGNKNKEKFQLLIDKIELK